MKSFYLAVLLSLSIASTSYADHVIWKGNVSSDGTPTHPIKLELLKKYRIQVRGNIDLGKWWKQGKELASDSCYEYADGIAPTKVDSIKNSMNISVCEGIYHSNHIYDSNPFVATQNRIHFWVNDLDYDDNSGHFEVQITEIASP
jgi:hypothetical protein